MRHPVRVQTLAVTRPEQLRQQRVQNRPTTEAPAGRTATPTAGFLLDTSMTHKVTPAPIAAADPIHRPRATRSSAQTVSRLLGSQVSFFWHASSPSEATPPAIANDTTPPAASAMAAPPAMYVPSGGPVRVV